MQKGALASLQCPRNKKSLHFSNFGWIWGMRWLSKIDIREIRFCKLGFERRMFSFGSLCCCVVLMSKLTEVVVSKLHSIALCWAAEEEDWLESLEFFQPFWLDLVAEKSGDLIEYSRSSNETNVSCGF